MDGIIKEQAVLDFIRNLLVDNRKEDFLITGGFALFLHSKIKGILFTRVIQDVDIYTFKKIRNTGQQTAFDEYAVKNNTLHDVYFENPDFYLDLFSNGYLFDTISPTIRDVIEVLFGSVQFQISSIEHILMLKLCTTYCLREKDIEDIVFILNNFTIDKDLCSELLTRSKCKDLNIDLSKLNGSSVYYLLADIREKIIAQYSNDFIDLGNINHSYLVTLLNYERIDFVEQSDFERFSTGLTFIDEILKLGFAFFFNGIAFNESRATIFNKLAKGLIGGQITDIAITIFLTRCRYLNQPVIRNSLTEEIVGILDKIRFMKAYHKKLEA